MEKEIPSSYIFLKYDCPKCHRYNIVKVKVPNNGEIGRCAVDHGDHILVIEYDNNGAIRGLNVYKKEIEVGGTVFCPICHRPINIHKNGRYNEYAYVHDNHAVIVYVYGHRYLLEIVDLISEE